VRQIRRFRPDLVIAQNPVRRQDGNPFVSHPDHLATGEATMAAVYPAARDRLNFPELVHEEGLEPWKVRQVLVTGVERPNLFLDVSSTFEIGLQAIFCHASQIADAAYVEERMRQGAANCSAGRRSSAATSCGSPTTPTTRTPRGAPPSSSPTRTSSPAAGTPPPTAS